MVKGSGIKMVLLIKENNEWKQITKEEKKLLPPEERIKVLRGGNI